MDLIDCIIENQFLKELYPNGISSSLCIGRLELDADADFILEVHVPTPPAREVKKWGQWEIDYNKVVLILRGTRINNIEFSGLRGMDFQAAKCGSNDKKFTYESIGKNWKTRFTFSTLTLEKCRTYFT